MKRRLPGKRKLREAAEVKGGFTNAQARIKIKRDSHLPCVHEFVKGGKLCLISRLTATQCRDGCAPSGLRAKTAHPESGWQGQISRTKGKERGGSGVWR